MQADWEFEISRNAPVIDANWAGLVDLRLKPEDAFQLAEAAQFPALADVLCRLNAAESPFWTSKCDYFATLATGEYDPDELEAEPKLALCATACYIDLLPSSGREWRLPAEAGDACKSLCARLKLIPLLCCRVDLVVRRAYAIDLGMTAYITACGATEIDAAAALEKALCVFADAVGVAGTSSVSATKLQSESVGE